MDFTYEQLQDDFLLIGAVLSFRQLWQQTQVRRHPVERVGAAERSDGATVSGCGKLCAGKFTRNPL